MSKIGIGIITCDRPDFFIKCRESIKPEWYSDIVVVNDGETPLEDIALAPVLKTNGGEGVGKAKNKAIKHLLKKECEYIILIEDDMLFKGDLFKQYIKAYQKADLVIMKGQGNFESFPLKRSFPLINKQVNYLKDHIYLFGLKSSFSQRSFSMLKTKAPIDALVCHASMILN